MNWQTDLISIALVIQKSSKRPRATSRRQYQGSDDDDDDDLGETYFDTMLQLDLMIELTRIFFCTEFVPKKRRMSKSFPGEKSVPIEKQEVRISAQFSYHCRCMRYGD
jgi:hypothetical protein